MQLLDKSNSSAAVFLTVYPTDGFTILTDLDYTALAQQCSDCAAALGFPPTVPY